MTRKEKQGYAVGGNEELGPRPRLASLIIKNFRCIGPDPVTIDLDDIVVLVGPNNSGKSSVLRAYEVIMSEGSSEGKLTLDDFPFGKVDPDALPEIELHTIVYDNGPGPEWIAKTEGGESLVRERWIWRQVGAPERRGYNVEAGRWAEDTDKEKVPWGAAGIAKARRPQPHRIDAFAPPETQSDEIVKLLMGDIKERVKAHEAEKGDEKSSYSQLLSDIARLQKTIVEESQDAISSIEEQLTRTIERVFPNHRVVFDAKPEDDIEKTLNLFKASPDLLMGLDDGYIGSIDRQGSGARRTLLWAALRLVVESAGKKSPTVVSRPHVLLLDEPEICLHPSAIREACSLLYDLPATNNNWQVMVTTHSPCFVDFSRDHTTIVRVERSQSGRVSGTTIYRPDRAEFSTDDKQDLKMLNMCDPYIAEFFFGGQTVVVEGDTEYTAFKTVASLNPTKFDNIHIVRARGKATIVLLAKIMNQFKAPYAVLHDSDRPTYTGKDGLEKKNPAWAHNQTIKETVQQSSVSTRVVASVPNFELAFLTEGVAQEKPYNALKKMRNDEVARATIEQLLEALVDFSKPLPLNALEWKSIDDLAEAGGQSSATELSMTTPQHLF